MSIAKFKAAVAATDPKEAYVAIPAEVMAAACVELGAEFHAPGTAGHVAKQVAWSGITLQIDGQVTLPFAARPQAIQRFHRTIHLGPVLAAIAAQEAAQAAASRAAGSAHAPSP